MASKVDLRVGGIACGNPETGVWCGDCQLPARVRIHVLLLLNDRPMGMVRWEQCQSAGCPAAQGEAT